MPLEYFENFSNMSTPVDMMVWAHGATAGMFGIVLMLTVGIISFVSVRTTSNAERGIVGSGFALMTGIFLAIIGAINPMYITIAAVAMLASLAMLYLERI